MLWLFEFWKPACLPSGNGSPTYQFSLLYIKYISEMVRATLADLSAEPRAQLTRCKLQHFSVFLCPWLNCLANCQTTYKENYGPWGVLGKLHHWQFYLGELQGLDNASLKYDDRLEGMCPGPFYKLHKTLIVEKLKTAGVPCWSWHHGAKVNYHKFSLSANLKTESI